MEKELFVYLNGRYLPASEASVSVFDRGLNYGDGLFETMRAYRGRTFALELHLERLKKSAEELNIPIKIEEVRWNQIIEKLLELNSLKEEDSYLRITITRGKDFGGFNPAQDIEPTIIIMNKPISSSTDDRHKNGIRGTILEVRGKSPYNITNMKTLNFLPNLMGKMETLRRGADEGFFLDSGGNITEGTTSNIFLFRGDELLTPPIDCGILPGVTRNIIINLARDKGINVSEQGFDMNDLLNSDEAFVTNSMIEITPLIEVDRRLIGDGKPGKRTKELQQAYKEKTKPR